MTKTKKKSPIKKVSEDAPKIASTMSAMKDIYQGKPAAILGGGPSLPGDIANLPDGCLLIAVNYHALQLCVPQFMVYNDDPLDPEMAKAIATPNLIKVSPHRTSDIQFDMDVWTGFNSANTAAWFALWMGCDPVILCGMDLYQSDRPYFHDYAGDQPSFHYPLDMHIRPWIEEGRNLLPNVGRLRVMSGPLTSVFKKYEAHGE